MLKFRLGGQVYIMPNHKNMHMVKILVNEDTNLELRSFEFRIPLRHALFNGEQEIFELLISFGANVCSLTPTETLSFILMMKSYILLKFFYCLLLGTNVNHHLKLPYQIRKLVQ